MAHASVPGGRGGGLFVRGFDIIIHLAKVLTITEQNAKEICITKRYKQGVTFHFTSLTNADTQTSKYTEARKTHT